MFAIRLVPVLFFAAFVLFCKPHEKSRDHIFEKIYARAEQYVKGHEDQYPELAESVSIIKEPSKEVLLPVERPDQYLYIAHVGWSVLLMLAEFDGNVLDLKYLGAKAGFSLTGDGSAKLILHKHPGTGMFYNLAYTVSVQDNKIFLKEIDDVEELEAIDNFLRMIK